MSLLHPPTLPMLSGHGAHRAEPPRKVRSERDELACALVAETTRTGLLQYQLDQAGIDYTGALEDLREAREGNARLAAANARLVVEVTRLQAAFANATRIDVAAGRRDIDPDDQPTQPINVAELRQRFDTGPIRRLNVSPHAADPTHVPGTAVA